MTCATCTRPSDMQNSAHLLRTRRFLPIFVTQFLGAFNDNLFRTSMVMLVIYGIYRDATQEATFSAIAGGLFILPFFLLSALAGQFADERDKARIVRIVKTAEILIMLVGAAGLLLHNVPLLLARAVRDGRPLDLLRPDQICHPAAASAARTKCSAGPGWSRPAPISASSAARCLAACSWCSGPTAASMPNGPRWLSWWSRSIGRFAGPFRAPCPARRPTRRRSRWTGTSSAHRSRLVSAHPAHPAAVPGDHRDQLLLGDGRGARRPVPAAGQERAGRRPDRRDLVPRHLLGRRRGRLGRGQPPAPGQGLGALLRRRRRC